MKAVRVGQGIKGRRQQCQMQADELAKKADIDESKLYRLEEGYEPEVAFVTLLNIARALGICMRGTPSPEQLINQFLYVTKEAEENERPLLI